LQISSFLIPPFEIKAADTSLLDTIAAYKSKRRYASQAMKNGK
jgi:hypothetical protein